ncbi:MAG: ImmA/IrrE family metallo-endopeptidase [Proteobacteria bacterium]|nr:ImmA/IrrE family metallo-endopeptidase [Pseudomonadota bacterium]MBU1542375.1 ImmA/IrrE family metallo-endopeptidase [Pseudomonadota bacterium]MBU2430541.1 ImmA/IrrE family metallo-endopeptidase [Pseudomonadota bacterium]
MTNYNSFNPNRLRFAREARAFTIKKLSEELHISAKTLSIYENGQLEPSKDDLLNSLSNILQFPIDFFFMDDVISLEKTIVSFRSLARMSASTRNASLCSGRLALEFIGWVENKIELPPNSIPDYRYTDPEAAALKLRTQWTIGDRPIKNLIHLLEAKGVKVFSLNRATFDMDAYSFWIENKAFIFLNTIKSVERSRFDTAHELGHLVLHKHGAPSGKMAEIEANRFASAFLMPESDIRHRAIQYISLSDVIKLKTCWLVSAAALIRRLKDLSIITEWHYNRLNIDLSSAGFRAKEPDPISIEYRERSKLIPMIFKLLREEGITKGMVSNALGIYQKDLDDLFFNLALTGIEGGASTNPNDGHRNQPNLKLI